MAVMDEEFKKWATIHANMGFIFTIEDIADSMGVKPDGHKWAPWLRHFEHKGLIVKVGTCPARDPQKRSRRITEWRNPKYAREWDEYEKSLKVAKEEDVRDVA